MSSIYKIKEKYAQKIDFLDLDLIISESIKKTREFVLSHPEKILKKSELSSIKSKVARRLRGEPLAYILGHKEFFGLNFMVNKNTLIPRPETEILVAEALTHIKKIKNKSITIIDIGTGSGCIIISIAKAISNFKFQISLIGIDISKKALAVAKKNAKINKISEKIKFISGNLLNPLFIKNKLKINSEIIILANLPYLDSEWKNLLKSSDSIGIKFEPKLALEGGTDGLDLYRKLAKQIKDVPKNNKITLFCEIGNEQKKEMERIFSFAKKSEFKKDLNNKWRIVKIEL